MGRLIDTSDLHNMIMLNKSNWGIFATQIDNLIEEVVMQVSTVEAIPKADIQKALKEGSKDISENVLAIVREEYISKADYEARLKADMVAMLTEIQLEIAEFMGTISPNYDEAAQDISQVIQQKINSLKVESEPKESEDNNGSNNN